MSWYQFREYVPVHVRRAQALMRMQELRKEGKAIYPVEIDGRTIARSFWGKQWCDHMESFNDFSNRLPRGRRYARNGSVCHLDIQSGRVEAIVSGSELYNISVTIEPLADEAWSTIVNACRGQIGSMLELLQGKLSDEVMRVVVSREQGLLPQPGEIHFECDCPDWASMCKHVAAVFYGIGNRLDRHPELLFLLRNVNAEELISADVALPAAAGADAIAQDQLADIFDIELDEATVSPDASTNATAAGSRRPVSGGGSRKRPAKTKAGRKTAKAKRPAKSKTTAGKRAAKAVKASKAKKKKKAARSAGSAPAGKTKAAKTKAAKTQSAPFKPTGAAVKRLRKELGLSVAEFANAAGVTTASVYRWEKVRGKLRLQPRTQQALTRLKDKQ